MSKKDDYIVKFDVLSKQGKLLDNYERIVNNFLVFYYCLIVFQGWVPDSKFKSVNKKPLKYKNTTLYANEGALATLQKTFVKKALEESGEEFDDEDDMEEDLEYYPDEGTIKYKDRIYGVKGLTEFIKIVYEEMRSEILKQEYMNYFRKNKILPKKLSDKVLEYLNEKIEKNIFF